MHKYIVHEQKECGCVNTPKTGDYYSDFCWACNNTKHIKAEVSLKEALLDILTDHHPDIVNAIKSYFE